MEEKDTSPEAQLKADRYSDEVEMSQKAWDEGPQRRLKRAPRSVRAASISIRAKDFDVWEDQLGPFIQERGVPLPEEQHMPVILVATLRAENLEEAWWQFRQLRPHEMPRFYILWEDEWGTGVGVEGHPLSLPDGKILKTFWADSFREAKKELDRFLAARASTDS